MENLQGFLTLGILLCIYMIPTFIAINRKKKNRGVVIATNILFGWTLLGWAIALIMAYGEQE